MFCAPLALALALVYFTGHPVVAAVAVVAAAMIIDVVIAKDSPSAVYSAPTQPERPQAPAWPSTLQRQRVRARVSDLNWQRVAFWPGVEVRSPVFKLGAPGLRVALALLLLFTGCGPAADPYLHTGLDSASHDDTGEGEIVDNAFTFVEGLPVECPSVRPYVKLPQDENGEAITSFSEAEVDLAVRGDADYSGPPVTLYPVVYADPDGLGGEGDHWLVSGWWTYDTSSTNGGGVYLIRHGEAGGNYGDDGGPLEPFTLACG
jgi:hypothetical protein